MTKEQRKIMKLTKKLHDLTGLVDEIKERAIDPEWDAHHCTILVVGDSIDEYQVLRHVDIEIDYDHDVEQTVYNLLTPEQQQQVNDGKLDMWENFEDEMTENQYTFEFGEFLQQWINLKTGQITNIGKPYKNTENCDWTNKYWDILTPDMKFTKHFLDGNYSGFYCDIKINPILKDAGYIALESTYYDWRDDDHKNYTANFIRNTDMAVFISDIVSGKTIFGSLIKMYDMEEILYMLTLEQPYQDAYKAAMRIRRKNKYVPCDMGMWQDHVETLYKLGKDLHNAYYVCPKDLHGAHTHYTDMLRRKREKELLLKRMQEAIVYEKEFKEAKEKYLGLLFTDKAHFTIAPLQTVKDFAEEGAAMHHCVYTNGYYKNKNNLILSTKDLNGKRLATIEFDLISLNIVQCRGVNNSVPQFDSEIRQCINDHIKQIKRLRDKKYRKTA